MNKRFIDSIKESLLNMDETSLAEIFNIFANDIDNLQQTLRKEEVYVFNICDNRQAAHAVRKFGFNAIHKASQDDWIIYAEKNESGNWIFSSKAPSVAIEEYLEYIICDIIARPKEYPQWVIDTISVPFLNLALGNYN